jgi:hypothetical protein
VQDSRILGSRYFGREDFQEEGPLQPLFTKCLEEVFSDTELPGVVILESVLMVIEKELQRWEYQKDPPLEFLGFAGSA